MLRPASCRKGGIEQLPEPPSLTLVGYVKTASLYSREDESVAVNEIWVLGVEGHEFVEQDMGGRSQA